jgi:hypothetical protein
MIAAFAVMSAVFLGAEGRGEVVLYAPPAAREGLGTLLEELRAWGLSPVWRDVDGLKADRERVHVVLDAATLPLSKENEIIEALHGGGRWIFAGTPAFSDPAFAWEGKLLPRSTIRKEVEATEPSHVAIAPRIGEAKAWSRSTNTPERAERHEVVDSEHGPALHTVIEDLAGWDTLNWTTGIAIPEGHNLTIFWARGDATTKALSVEWREADGSRWIAVIPLEPAWRRYVLSEEDFKFWESRPERARTKLVLSRARECAVGVAYSHTGLRAGRNEYWIASIGTAQRVVPDGFFGGPKPFEGLCPEYKFYETEAAARVAPSPEFVAGASLPGAKLAAKLSCLHPRPNGSGIERDRPFRFVPVLECFDAKSSYRGACAALFVGSKEPHLKSVWASFPQPPALIAKEPIFSKSIAAAAAAMAEGVFFMSAGTDRFTYFPDQTVTAGVDVINCGTNDVTVKLHGTPAPGTPRRLTPGEIWKERWTLSGKDAATYASGFVAELHGENGCLDKIAQPVHILKLPAKPSFVTVKDGHFIRNGERWRPHGINYMPSSGIGLEDWIRFERWLGGPSYDPVIIRRDLERAKEIGFDAVSVFLYAESSAAGNLVDFVRQCDELGLAVNLSLRPGTPDSYSWPAWRQMIVENRLAENPTIFAYDVAWEPGFRSIPQRRALDGAWSAWLAERYGSAEAAERALGFALPRAGDALTGPEGRLLWNEGPWRPLACAYRRFVDDYLAKRYRVALRRIRDVDPHHLVSYRMAESGDPTFRNENCLPYGFKGSARLMDFLAPEAYGRIGTWKDAVRPGVFTVAYGRAVAPEKPVAWAEIGMSIWNQAAGQADPDLEERQAKFFEDFYKLLRVSDSDGVFFWWYPGGFRTNENSDFGIINPDGTWRQSTRVINRNKLEGARGKTPKPGAVLTIDEEAFASGLWNAWESITKPFLAQVEEGVLPRLKLWPDGMTSANAPPRAVGGLSLPGGIVPAFLNGLFEKVEARVAGGEPQDLVFGGAVTARKAGGAATGAAAVRASIVNCAPATWLAAGDGSVALILARAGSGDPRTIALPHDVPYLGSVEVEFSLPAESATWTLTMWRRDGLLFGERLAIEVKVVP